MLKIIVHLKSAAPYSQSRQFERECPKDGNETHDQYEIRCWRLRAHTTSTKLIEIPDSQLGKRKAVARVGNIVIPGIAFQRIIVQAAQERKDKIPGKSNQTYLNTFRTGLIVIGDLELPISGVEVEGQWVSCSPRGRAGETGVWRCFPLIPEWEGKIELAVFNEMVMTETARHEPVLYETLRTAGQFGIGRWRPIKSGGQYGRFEVVGTEEVA